MKLSKRTIDGLQPEARQRTVFDDALSGFGVTINPGGTKAFVVKYRHRGRQRWATIGRYGAMTPDQARTRAKVLLGKVASGDDPLGGDKTDIVNAALDAFVKDHCQAKLRPKTAQDYQKLIDRLIRPTIGTYRIDAVTRQDVAKLHTKLKKTPRQANFVLAILSSFFNWCEVEGLREEGSLNPCDKIKKNPEVKRDRFLKRQEYARLARVLDDEGLNPYAVAAIRLLALTGCRLSEILHLAWDEVDIEAGCIRLSEDRSKAGARIVSLNQPAIDLLAAMPRVADNPYVIVGKVAGKHMVNLEKPWLAIRKAAGIEDITIHGLRHSFGSVAAGLGYSELVIGGLLGHSKQGVTQRYSHLEGDMLARAAEQVGGLISEMMK